MTVTGFTPQEEEDTLAAEYVLGVLDLAERSATETRIKKDRAFADLVASWENHFSGLNDAYDEVPAPNLLPRIEERLFPVAARPVRAGWFGWLGGAIVAGALVLVTVSFVDPPRANLVAELTTSDAALSYRISQLNNEMTITRVAGGPASPGQVHQLWIIAPGQSPVSLGLLENEPLVVSYPTPPDGWLFAVSVEPTGGSPSGLPTGPVILSSFVNSDA